MGYDLSYKKPDIKKLISYGFVCKDGRVYGYSDCNEELNMRLCVNVNEDGVLDAHIYDCDTEDEYVLHLVGGEGEFIGKVRAYLESELESIVDNCFETSVFKCRQTDDVLNYAREKYGGDAEYLWDGTPDCCIVRRQDNRKWYLIIMTVDGVKLGLKSGIIEIMNLRCEEEELNLLADREKYFRGYHMNKRLWLTLVLDGRVPLDEIKSRIDKSYKLVGKNK